MKYLKLLIVLFIVSCSSTKELKGSFENLEKTDQPKNPTFKVSVKETNKSEIPDEKGAFKIKYPKKGGTLMVSTKDNYVIIEKPIPLKAESAIVLINDLGEMIKFLEKDQDFDQQYDIAKKEFRKIPISLDQFPIYPGCENKDVKSYRDCFQRKVNQHIQKHFNTQLANDLGLPTGRNKIQVLFEIDKEGNVNSISAKASHPRLEKEGIRIAKKLPVMKPGINRNKPVKVDYSLPIIFSIQ